MTAAQKLEGLTHSWYGYAVFGAAVSLWQNGLGFFSLLGTAASFAFSVVLTWFIGRRLLRKSSLTRLILVIFTAISSLFGTLGVAKLGWTFLHTMSLDALVAAAIAGVVVYMNARSFRVLTDASVQAYFR